MQHRIAYFAKYNSLDHCSFCQSDILIHSLDRIWGVNMEGQTILSRERVVAGINLAKGSI
jgi:hypothetical protein